MRQEQRRNGCARWIWTLLLVVPLTTAQAQNKGEVVWLSLADEGGNRVEVVASPLGTPFYLRHYQEDQVLVEEYVVEGRLFLSGEVMAPFQRLILDLERTQEDDDLEEVRQPEEVLITDNIGSGTPPGGSSGGGTATTTSGTGTVTPTSSEKNGGR